MDIGLKSELGGAAGIGVYTAKEYAKALAGSKLTIEVREALEGGGFSLETPLDKRFCLTSCSRKRSRKA
jgi:uncharacterized protein (DUF779 family)